VENQRRQIKAIAAALRIRTRSLLARRRAEEYPLYEGLPLRGAEDHRMDIVAWLRGLGLERYAPASRDNDVDGEVLPELTSDDLISIGVTSVGHRRKLLAAISSLGATPPASTVMAAPREAPAPADAERRQLTVMFCDLVGSTDIISAHRPGELREVIGAYHRAVTEVAAGFDGFVAKYMSDGLKPLTQDQRTNGRTICRRKSPPR
jgi:hypothetical protein